MIAEPTPWKRDLHKGSLRTAGHWPHGPLPEPSHHPPLCSLESEGSACARLSVPAFQTPNPKDQQTEPHRQAFHLAGPPDFAATVIPKHL